MDWRWNCLGVWLVSIVMTVSSSGVVGSSLAPVSCPSCMSDTSPGCRVVSGLFTKIHLPPGLTTITTIPMIACNISITFFRPSRNHLAITLGTSHSLVGASTTESGVYWVAGTQVHYTRGSSTVRERVQVLGPLPAPLIVQLQVEERNGGVEYRYMVPGHIKQRRPTRHRKRHSRKGQYRWSLKTVTACSQSCGGGTQDTEPVCVRRAGQKVVTDSECRDWKRPEPRQVQCNRASCPAAWEAEEWGPCLGECGDQGIQERRVKCKQRLSSALSLPVPEAACSQVPPLAKVQPCSTPCTSNPMSGPSPGSSSSPSFSASSSSSVTTTLADSPSYSNAPNNFHNSSIASSPSVPPHYSHAPSHPLPPSPSPSPYQWVSQPWGPCSVTCGEGVKERRIHCLDTRGGMVPDSRCRPHYSRPLSEDYCNVGPCVEGMWLVGQWEQCSTSCGRGSSHRRVECLGECQGTKPDTVRDCQGPVPCEGEWVTGRWTSCSHSCGVGRQTRRVECLVGEGTRARLGEQGECEEGRKPRLERECHIQECAPTWFTGEWSQCSPGCGSQTRSTICLHNSVLSDSCRKTDTPSSSRDCHSQVCSSHTGGKMDTEAVTNDQEMYNDEEEEEEEYDEELEQEEVEEKEEEEEVKETELRVNMATVDGNTKLGFEDLTIEDVGEGSGLSDDHDVEEEEDEEKDEEEVEEMMEELDDLNDNPSEFTNNGRVATKQDSLSNEIVVEKHRKQSKSQGRDGCTDTFKNCNVVMQSRLCHYSFYRRHCCHSCDYLG